MAEKKSNQWMHLSYFLAVLLIISIGSNLYLNSKVAKAISGGADIGTGDSDTPTAVAPTQPTQPTAPAAKVEVSVDDDAMKGDDDAPVTIVEFSEYQCPFCGRYVTSTYPAILKKYVDTGKVKYVFRDFPLGFHEHAQKAGEAAECAGEQNRYWEYHDVLFENQGALEVASLKTYAEELGLDTDKFDECLDSGAMEAEVKADFEAGRAAGVSGTPTFFINGVKLVGAQPIAAFEQAIEAALAEE